MHKLTGMTTASVPIFRPALPMMFTIAISPAQLLNTVYNKLTSIAAKNKVHIGAELNNKTAMAHEVDQL